MFSHFCTGSDIRTTVFNFLNMGKPRFPPKKFYSINYWIDQNCGSIWITRFRQVGNHYISIDLNCGLTLDVHLFISTKRTILVRLDFIYKHIPEQSKRAVRQSSVLWINFQWLFIYSYINWGAIVTFYDIKFLLMNSPVVGKLLFLSNNWNKKPLNILPGQYAIRSIRKLFLNVDRMQLISIT